MDDKTLRAMYHLGQLVVIKGRVVSFIAYDRDIPDDDWLVPGKWRREKPPDDAKSWEQRGWPYRILSRISFDSKPKDPPEPKEPVVCMILGWTTRYIGSVEFRTLDRVNDDYDPGYIDVDTRFLVFQVQPYTKDGRYRKPITVLPEQILSGTELSEWMKKNVTENPGRSEGVLSQTQSSMSFLEGLSTDILRRDLQETLLRSLQH